MEDYCGIFCITFSQRSFWASVARALSKVMCSKFTYSPIYFCMTITNNSLFLGTREMDFSSGMILSQ